MVDKSTILSHLKSTETKRKREKKRAKKEIEIAALGIIYLFGRLVTANIDMKYEMCSRGECASFLPQIDCQRVSMCLFAHIIHIQFNYNAARA